MIHGSVVGGESLIQSTNLYSSAMMSRVRTEVARLAVEMVTRVKADKLSGQVLKVLTGRLRRSITFRLNNGPNTATATVGTNVEYARAHEYGFSGPVTVRAYLRKTVHGDAQVRSHTRTMNLPERSFLRSTLADMRTAIVGRLNAAAAGKGLKSMASTGVAS